MNIKYNKYSIICQKVINDNKEVINKFISTEYFSNEIKNNNFITLLEEKINKTRNVKNGYNMELNKLYKIHEMKDVPLLYILFNELYEINILKNIFTDLPTDFNFETFLTWFRKSQRDNIIDKIKVKSEEIIDNKSKYKLTDEQHHNLQDIYSVIFNTEGPREKLHNILYNNSFVSIDIQHHAETSNMEYCNYNFDDGTVLTVYTVDNNHQLNIEFVKHIITFMEDIADSIFKTKIKTKPNITFFLGLQKKLIDSADLNFLSPDNVNSGSTLMHYSIDIWRYEEVYKVLIHELIHFYGIDFYIKDKDYDILQNSINNKFCVHGFDRPNESYTETLAIIIHTLFISKYTNDDFYILLWKELIHNILQINKIFDFYKINNIDDIKKNNNTCNKTIEQKTSVFSYFIIKTVLLYNISDFITFITNNIPSNRYIENFSKLIENSVNKSSHIFNNLDQLVKNIKISSNYIKNNLRMSCLQIDF